MKTVVVITKFRNCSSKRRNIPQFVDWDKGCFLRQQPSHFQSPFVIYVHCEQGSLVNSYASKLVTKLPFWIQLQADGLLQPSEKLHKLTFYVTNTMS
jgi:hypothetical protein